MTAAIIPDDQPTVLQVINLNDGSVRQTISVEGDRSWAAPTDAIFDHDGWLALRVQAQVDGVPMVALVTVNRTGEAWRGTDWSQPTDAPFHLVTATVV